MAPNGPRFVCRIHARQQWRRGMPSKWGGIEWRSDYRDANVIHGSTGRIVRLGGGIAALMVSLTGWAAEATMPHGMVDETTVRPFPLVLAASDADMPADINSLFGNDHDEGGRGGEVPSSPSAAREVSSPVMKGFA